MTKRYVTIGETADRPFWDQVRSADASITVFQPDPEPRFTGLYDAAGCRLYSVEDRPPLGFVHFKT